MHGGLWHHTVFMFLFRHTSTGPWTRPFVLADLTYRFVERPGIAWAGRWTLRRQAAQPSAFAVPAA